MALSVKDQKKLILKSAVDCRECALKFPHSRETYIGRIQGMQTAVHMVWNDTCQLYKDLDKMINELRRVEHSHV